MPGQRRRPWDDSNSNAGSGKATKRAKREAAPLPCPGSDSPTFDTVRPHRKKKPKSKRRRKTGDGKRRRKSSKSTAAAPALVPAATPSAICVEEKQSLDESIRKTLVMVQARGLLSVQQIIYLLAPVSKAMRGWLLFDYSWIGPIQLRPQRAITDGRIGAPGGTDGAADLEPFLVQGHHRRRTGAPGGTYCAAALEPF